QLDARATQQAPASSTASSTTTSGEAASAASTTPSTSAAPDAPAAAALPRAVAAHLDIARGRGPTQAALAAAVAAWDAALADGEVQKWLARRAIELDAPPGAVDRALRDVATAVTDELARIADQGA